MNAIEKEECFCSKCSNHYLCYVVGKHKNSIYNVELGGYDINIYYILKCPGCSGVTFKTKYFLSFDGDEIENDEQIHVEYFPKYNHKIHSDIFLSNYSVLKNDKYKVLLRLIKEIRTAIDDEQYMLAAMGQRSLIDILCKIILGDNDNSFAKNVNECVTAGYLSKKHHEILMPVLDFGHSAVHRGMIPNKYDVIMAMKIVLNLIDTYLVHFNHAKSLKDRLPKRKNPKEKKVKKLKNSLSRK